MKIGGSDAAAICGISPWQTPLEAYLKITGQLAIQDSPQMEWGRRLEPVVRQKYIEATGRKVFYNENPKKFGVEFQHPEYSFIQGSLDGLSESHEESRVLEIKTARSRDAWIDGVPEYYQCQIAHYLACTGLDRADVAVLFGASDFEIFELERDQELIDLLIGAEVEFWNKHVLPMNPPDPATINDAALRWPRSISVQVQADEQIAAAIDDLKMVRRAIENLEANKADLELQIKAAMQEADTLMVGGKPAVTWKLSKPTTAFNKDLFSIEHPELFKKYFVERPGSRRFLIKQ